MTTRDGGPAFPSANDMRVGDFGMTLRDYFAAKAMQGMWANRDFVIELKNEHRVAKAAYDQADAMLAARATDNNGKEG